MKTQNSKSTPPPVVILAGGLGSRLSEETATRPKPMIDIGGLPILWHIMKIFSTYGCHEFVIALGYKGEVIKDYFLNYRHRASDMTISLKLGTVKLHNNHEEDWTVHLIDTGQNTQTGGRVKRAIEFLGKRTFFLTYGDGVSDVDINRLLMFHQEQGKIATVTAVRPPARFGGLDFDGDLVGSFVEKPQIGEGWINGGFFVLEPEIAGYLDGDDSVLEQDPMRLLVQDRQLAAYKHHGFWQCMDTLRDVKLLNDLWAREKALWKTWK